MSYYDSIWAYRWKCIHTQSLWTIPRHCWSFFELVAFLYKPRFWEDRASSQQKRSLDLYLYPPLLQRQSFVPIWNPLINRTKIEVFGLIVWVREIEGVLILNAADQSSLILFPSKLALSFWSKSFSSMVLYKSLTCCRRFNDPFFASFYRSQAFTTLLWISSHS